MSDLIRAQIDPTKNYLVKILDQVPNHEVRFSADMITIEQKQNYLFEINLKVLKDTKNIKTFIGLLEGLNERWMKYIETLKGSSKEDEKKLKRQLVKKMNISTKCKELHYSLMYKVNEPYTLSSFPAEIAQHSRTLTSSSVGKKSFDDNTKPETKPTNSSIASIGKIDSNLNTFTEYTQKIEKNISIKEEGIPSAKYTEQSSSTSAQGSGNRIIRRPPLSLPIDCEPLDQSASYGSCCYVVMLSASTSLFSASPLNVKVPTKELNKITPVNQNTTRIS
ncbi:hypothetical protein Ddc_20927 [Ditylenchus destructor]|nr:hypothetical protein Ddc_20927 [Ditylenchus destructor]